MDFSRLLPDDEEVNYRKEQWESIFKKYSAVPECSDDDGMDMDDVVACAEAEEDSDIEREYEEELEDDTEKHFDVCEDSIVPDEEMEDCQIENERQLALIPAGRAPQQYDQLLQFFDRDFIDGYKNAYEKRMNELSKLNLPYWNYSKQTEEYKENHIQTPNLVASSKHFMRTSENASNFSQNPHHQSMPDLRQDLSSYRNGSMNGTSEPNLSFTMSQPSIPFQLQQLLQSPNGSFNIRIRELHYDISIDGQQDLSSLFHTSGNSSVMLPMNISCANNNCSRMAIKAPPAKSNKTKVKKRPLLNLPPPEKLAVLPPPTELKNDMEKEKRTTEQLKVEKAQPKEAKKTTHQVKSNQNLTSESLSSSSLPSSSSTSTKNNKVKVEKHISINLPTPPEKSVVLSPPKIKFDDKKEKHTFEQLKVEKAKSKEAKKTTHQVKSNQNLTSESLSSTTKNNKVKVLSPPKIKFDVEKEKPKKVHVEVKKNENLQVESKQKVKSESSNSSPPALKTKKRVKKMKRVISSSSSSSSSSEEEDVNTHQRKSPPIEVDKNLKSNPIVELKTLTIDDMSCGSSCSTVTSDEDSKFFQAERFNKLRREKQFNHRKVKLEKRLKAMNLKETDNHGEKSEKTKVERAEAAKVEKAKETKHEEKKDQKKTILVDSSSSAESDDDFFVKAVNRYRMNLNK